MNDRNPLTAELAGEIEAMAVEFARLAGAEIATSLERTLAVRYKTPAPGLAADAPPYRDPVTEVDHSVEALIRGRLSERFPEHDVIGEEIDDRPGRNHDIVWAVDPVDGTANFVNGFPLFAASIGVLHRGRPIAGAIWCSATHALRAGVYHAALGGNLRLDGEPCTRPANPTVRRRLAGLPPAAPADGLPFETRSTGSAAIECAFVAAGLLAAARFDRPNLWDVAGGTALVLAAGGAVAELGDNGWQPFGTFEPAADGGSTPDLQRWRRTLAMGEKDAVARLTGDRSPRN